MVWFDPISFVAKRTFPKLYQIFRKIQLLQFLGMTHFNSLLHSDAM